MARPLETTTQSLACGDLSHGVFITYDADRQQDGSGAQVQRVIGLAGLAQVLRLPYVHTPVKWVEANPGDPFVAVADRQLYLERLRCLLELPGARPTNLIATVRIQHVTRWMATLLRSCHRVLRLFRLSVLVSAGSASPWIESNVDAYEPAAQVIRERLRGEDFREDGAVLNVHVHLRRAVTPPQAPSGRPNERYTAGSWARDCIAVLHKEAANTGHELAIYVHTDGIPHALPWDMPHDVTDETTELWRENGLIDDHGRLRQHSEDFASLFENLGTVEILQGGDPIVAWQRMLAGDVLIMGKSSFSYVAGLLRPVGALTICAPFWHGPRPDWVVVTEPELEPHQSARQIAVAMREMVERGETRSGP